MYKKKLTTITAGLLIAGQTLLQSFSAAAQPLEKILGVPYIVLEEGEIDTSTELNALGDKKILMRKKLVEAMERMRFDPAIRKKTLKRFEEGSFYHLTGIWFVLSGPAAEAIDGGALARGDIMRSDDGYAYAAKYGTDKGGLISMGSFLNYQELIASVAHLTGRMPSVTAQDYYELARLHEMAHVGGANEPQADQVASILYLKKHPSRRDVVQFHRDYRQIEFFDHFMRGQGRLIKGQSMIDATDQVLAMSQEEIDAFNDVSLRKFLEEGAFNLSREGVATYDKTKGIEIKKIVALLERDDQAMRTAHLRTMGFNREAAPGIGMASMFLTHPAGALARIRDVALKSPDIDKTVFLQIEGAYQRMYPAQGKNPFVPNTDSAKLSPTQSP